MKLNSSSGGFPPPRFGSPATDRPSYGDAVAAVAEVLETPLMPWQRHVVQVALEHDHDRLVYRDAVVTTPRQSGKSSLVLALVVARLLSAPGQRVAYTAQTRLAARGKLFDTWFPRLRRSALGDLFTLTRASGAEALRCANGSMLSLLSTDVAAGHGEVLDLAILDECWALDATAEQAVRPALSTRPNGMLWCLSTAGGDRSVYWRQRVDAGRTAAQLGLTEGTFYAEWSAADDTDVTDRATWPTFMPALGHTIDESTVAADLGAMSLPEWRRAYGNQWPDAVASGWAVFDKSLWEAARARQ